MELHLIRCFLAVQATRNLSRAASRCCITQPALTRAIQKLEDKVGGPLFLPRQRGVELTKLGREVAAPNRARCNAWRWLAGDTLNAERFFNVIMAAGN
jgi:LysR family transcriptional regulator, hydrogen peroxide-inducible genes activator